MRWQLLAACVDVTRRDRENKLMRTVHPKAAAPRIPLVNGGRSSVPLTHGVLVIEVVVLEDYPRTNCR